MTLNKGKLAAGGDDDILGARPRATPSSSAESATDKVTEAIMQGIRAGAFVPGRHLLEPDFNSLTGKATSAARQ
jgi:hypothetical protein